MGHELHDEAWASGELPDPGIAWLALAHFERARELTDPDSYLVPLARTALEAGGLVKARRDVEAAVAASCDPALEVDAVGRVRAIVVPSEWRPALSLGRP